MYLIPKKREAIKEEKKVIFQSKTLKLIYLKGIHKQHSKYF